MSLFDVFKKKSPLEKALKDLKEAYAQPEVRRTAAGVLLGMQTDEAYEAVLQRFTYNAHGNIADESEKRDLVGEIVRVGDAMVPALKNFIGARKAVGFPIRALSQIISRGECVNFLVESLQSKEPLDHRSTESKRALLLAIGDLGDATHAEALTPYLEDHHDDVQIGAIEALERLNNPETVRALAEVCCRDTHAARIQQRAAKTLMDLGVSAKPYYKRFLPEVKADYILGKKGVLARKTRGGAST